MLLRVLRRDVEPPRRHTRWPARSLPEVIRRARGQGYGGQPSGTRPTDKSFHRSIEPGTSPVRRESAEADRSDDRLEVVPLLDWTGTAPESGRRDDGDEGVPAVDGEAEGGAAPSADPRRAEARGRVPRARPQAV